MFTFFTIDTETPTKAPRFTLEIGWCIITSSGEIVKSYRALVDEVWALKPTKTWI